MFQNRIAGKRDFSKISYALGLFGGSLIYFICIGTQPARFPEDNVAEQWRWSLLGISAMCAAGTVVWPHRTFLILFVLIPVLGILSNIIYCANSQNWQNAGVTDPFPSTLISVGYFMWLGWSAGVEQANKLTEQDATQYTRLWQSYISQPGFQEALTNLWTSWQAVQAKAVVVPKMQTASSLCRLFIQADQLNDLIGYILFALSNRFGGEFYNCQTKKTNRALQKVFRSYQGDWRKLCDLCRCSIVFYDTISLAAFLQAVSQHPELVVVKASDDKMRLRENFDAGISGGYRDIQLSMKLINAQTRTMGIHDHIAEVQIHLDAIFRQKRDGGGHHIYVKARNLSGS